MKPKLQKYYHPENTKNTYIPELRRQKPIQATVRFTKIVLKKKKKNRQRLHLRKANGQYEHEKTINIADNRQV